MRQVSETKIYSRNVKIKKPANTSSAHLSPLIEINETSQLKKGMASAMCDNDDCHLERRLAGFPQLPFALVNSLPPVKNDNMAKVSYFFYFVPF